MFLVVTSRCRTSRRRLLRATALESEVAAGSFRNPRYEPQAVHLSPKTHGSPKACAVVASPEAVPSTRSRAVGVRCCRSNERCGSPERNVIPQAEVTPRAFLRRLVVSQAKPPVYFADEIRANTKFTQPEVWPTPAGRTGQGRLTKPRQSPTPFARGAPRCRLRCAANPVVVGPRTCESVRLAARTRHNRPA